MLRLHRHCRRRGHGKPAPDVISRSRASHEGRSAGIVFEASKRRPRSCTPGGARAIGIQAASGYASSAENPAVLSTNGRRRTPCLYVTASLRICAVPYSALTFIPSSRVAHIGMMVKKTKRPDPVMLTATTASENLLLQRERIRRLPRCKARTMWLGEFYNAPRATAQINRSPSIAHHKLRSCNADVAGMVFPRSPASVCVPLQKSISPKDLRTIHSTL